VIDASVVIDLLMRGPRGEAALEAVADHDLSAPTLIDAEVLSALARIERAGAASAEQTTAAVRLFERLALRRHPVERPADGTWPLRDRVRVTDAFYVALSRQLDLTLLTSDQRLGRVVREQALGDVVVLGYR
jgi:predicted nucleic acid-binding protein